MVSHGTFWPLVQPRSRATDHGLFHHILDAAEFKESEHPRAPDGKFGSKGTPSMPKGMEHVTKGAHKTVGSFCKALLTENKYSNAQIALASQSIFGGKTSPASVAWYKMKQKQATPEGAKQEAAKKAGVTANKATIAAAAKAPMPLAKMDAELSKAGMKTVFVKATKDGKTEFFKVGNVPDGVDNTVMLNKALGAQGYKIQSTAPFSASKPSAPDLKEMSLDPAIAATLKKEADEKAAAEAKAQKKLTEADEVLSEAIKKSIAHYTDGSYSTLNKQLREGQPMDHATATLAAHMDAAIAKSRLTENCTLYRGIAKPQAFFGPNITVGTVVIDNGYLSTSKHASIAVNFSQGGMLAVIKMQKGDHAIDVAGITYHSAEKEVVLGRGSMFKITGVYGKEVQLEYLRP